MKDLKNLLSLTFVACLLAGCDSTNNEPIYFASAVKLPANEQETKIRSAQRQFAGRRPSRRLAKAGYNIQVSSRSYVPYVDDDELEIRLIRAQEISRYVEHGYLDCGITGHDWIMENGSKVHEVGEFLFSKVSRRPARWVLCVPENSPVKSVKDLQGKRIATEVVNLTKKYLKKNGVKAEVEFSWGATEVKAHELVDAIVEVTETGSSLRANKCASWTNC
jgi:ATP phosphoribosyltransferase